MQDYDGPEQREGLAPVRRTSGLLEQVKAAKLGKTDAVSRSLNTLTRISNANSTSTRYSGSEAVTMARG